MSYTRLYPIAVGSYNPGSNPILESAACSWQGATAALINNIVWTTSAAGLTPGLYAGVAATTVTGSGAAATFDINVDVGGNIDSVVINNAGGGYVIGDTLLIPGASIVGAGGTTPADNVNITVASSRISNVSTLYWSAIDNGVSSGEVWYATVTTGAYTGTYVVVDTGFSGKLDLDLMNGTGPLVVTTPETSVRVNFFRGDRPSGQDQVPSAFMLTAPVAGALDVITTDGQFVSIPLAALVPGAIYSIGIREIIADGGNTGFLLGTSGFNGTPIYS